MTIRSILLFLPLVHAAPAAVVLTNVPGTVLTSSLIKGSGGVIPNPIEYGFEFTVGGGDHALTSIAINFGTHLGTVPVSVELYGSATGPDTAVFLTAMNGPAQPNNELAVFSPAIPITLDDGEIYFVRIWVNGAASSYAVPRTATPATGTWTMGNLYTRPAGSSWGTGTQVSETMV